MAGYEREVGSDPLGVAAALREAPHDVDTQQYGLRAMWHARLGAGGHARYVRLAVAALQHNCKASQTLVVEVCATLIAALKADPGVVPLLLPARDPAFEALAAFPFLDVARMCLILLSDILSNTGVEARLVEPARAEARCLALLRALATHGPQCQVVTIAGSTVMTSLLFACEAARAHASRSGAACVLVQAASGHLTHFEAVHWALRALYWLDYHAADSASVLQFVGAVFDNHPKLPLDFISRALAVVYMLTGLDHSEDARAAMVAPDASDGHAVLYVCVYLLLSPLPGSDDFDASVARVALDILTAVAKKAPSALLTLCPNAAHAVLAPAASRLGVPSVAVRSCSALTWMAPPSLSRRGAAECVADLVAVLRACAATAASQQPGEEHAEAMYALEIGLSVLCSFVELCPFPDETDDDVAESERTALLAAVRAGGRAVVARAYLMLRNELGTAQLSPFVLTCTNVFGVSDGSRAGVVPGIGPDGADVRFVRPDRHCDACGARGDPPAVKLSRCIRCRAALYCSAECQRGHWATHRTDCKALAALLAQEGR
jgi:hypothetical protein